MEDLVELYSDYDRELNSNGESPEKDWQQEEPEELPPVEEPNLAEGELDWQREETEEAPARKRKRTRWDIPAHIVPQNPTGLYKMAAKITMERHWSHIELPVGIVKVLQDLARAGVSKEIIREKTARAKKIIYADEKCHTHYKMTTLLHVIKSPSPFLQKWTYPPLSFSLPLVIFNIQNVRHIFLFLKESCLLCRAQLTGSVQTVHGQGPQGGRWRTTVTSGMERSK